jgi:hypothetical protein
MAKKISTANKATAVGGTTAALSTYAAMWLSQKYGVPSEVAALGAGTLLAWVARWAGKLNP